MEYRIFRFGHTTFQVQVLPEYKLLRVEYKGRERLEFYSAAFIDSVLRWAKQEVELEG